MTISFLFLHFLFNILHRSVFASSCPNFVVFLVEFSPSSPTPQQNPTRHHQNRHHQPLPIHCTLDQTNRSAHHQPSLLHQLKHPTSPSKTLLHPLIPLCSPPLFITSFSQVNISLVPLLPLTHFTHHTLFTSCQLNSQPSIPFSTFLSLASPGLRYLLPLSLLLLLLASREPLAASREPLAAPTANLPRTDANSTHNHGRHTCTSNQSPTSSNIQSHSQFNINSLSLSSLPSVTHQRVISRR